MDTQIAFITGGSKGIGLGITEVLLNEGYKVAFTSRSLKAAKDTEKHLSEKFNGQVLGIQADVRDLAQQEAAVNEVVEKWGKIDCFVANAGIGHFAPIEDLSPEQWKETIDINLTGVFNSAKASLNALEKSQGYFISIASLAGTNFFERGTAYNASKFGLVGFTQALMLDVRKKGINVSTIMPGSVATYFNGHTPSEADHWKIQPEDIGKLVLDLLNMPKRTLPSKIEVRPSRPDLK